MVLRKSLRRSLRRSVRSKSNKSNKSSKSNKSNKRFRGGSQPDATNIVSPDEPDDDRASTETYTGRHYAQNGDTMVNKDLVEQTKQINDKNSPGMPPNLIVGGLVGMLVMSLGVYIITQTVGKHHS